MIFLTVGTQLPFDRLVMALDTWAEARPASVSMGQIGKGGYRPRNFPSCPFMSPGEIEENIRKASVVVSHAGIGTILAALELGTPLIVMPRRAELREHRNGHQLATARYFQSIGQVSLAEDEESLFRFLSSSAELRARGHISRHAARDLIDSIRDFISNG